MQRTILILLIIFISTKLAHSQVEIDITRGNIDPLPIAISVFNSTDFDAKNENTGKKISDVISNNLARSGLFLPLDRKSFIEDTESIVERPRFGDWRVINAQALVTGSTKIESDGRLNVSFRLWDTFAEQQMTGLVYKTNPTNWRRIAHIISDQIYERLTGEKGYFDTRIVYV